MLWFDFDSCTIAVWSKTLQLNYTFGSGMMQKIYFERDNAINLFWSGMMQILFSED